MKRHWHQLALVLCSCLIAASACALHLPRGQRVAGGIVKIPFNLTGAGMPAGYFRDRRVAIIPVNQGEIRWLAVIGMPMLESAGQKTLRIVSPVSRAYHFRIYPKKYRSQRLRLKNRRMVNPAPVDRQRIQAEARQINGILKHWSNNNPFNDRFIVPVKGKVSAPFGLRRFYNGVARSPHDGLDIAAAKGTPVAATSGGVVIAVGNYFYTGNTVYIDHDYGLISMYAHLDSISVKRGRHIAKGNIIGTVGSTGRSTGPHLHWGMYLNQARVNPALFL